MAIRSMHPLCLDERRRFRRTQEPARQIRLSSAAAMPENAEAVPGTSIRPSDQERFRIAAEAAHRTQCDMTDDAGDPEIRIVDQVGGERFVFAQIRANDTRQVI